MTKPNVVGPLRYAGGLTILGLICVSPVVWLFVDALRSGNQGYIGATGLFAVPALVGLAGMFWGLYHERRGMMRSEFSEQNQPADAPETRLRAGE
jgi:hypothetical protein